MARGKNGRAVDGADRLRPLLGGVECQDDMPTICIGAM
jgi:hypothetical protein